jgi:hypothetical protein
MWRLCICKQRNGDQAGGLALRRPAVRNLGLQVPFQEVSAPSYALASPDGRPALFMFIAVFSTTDFRHRRDAVREAWMEEAARRTNVLPRFVLTGEHARLASSGDALMYAVPTHSGAC